MVFKNDKFGDDKHYSISSNFSGGFTLREFENRKRKTELSLSPDEKMMFVNRLKEQGWYEYMR